MIRKATLKDIDKLLEITKACAASMVVKNIYQWNEFYPNKQPFLKDFERSELYIIELENTIIGCITISTFMDEEYIPISWLTPNLNNIYIHRLAIHPNEQGKGYAQKLMDYAEHYAKKNNFTSVRLDTFSQNAKNLKFYELRGYKRLGEIYFPKQSKHPFYCYELIL
ncbi:N-acetylglutamate synthase, GNAT family [Flaviramulus basaltis]|uniref:N-acetylglutamate synthase, GNAT family n=1 Tax=Flaviramulus basaltis TaxID=369401 RepID=A0A1K2IDJ2_9FLAO|nr:GNAT family N-acetyltransferase [Flaviramulus basaltis]SFZ90338.1 N-acetylglutamate synthase, GNAT family [Flaviramulus basaltis]